MPSPLFRRLFALPAALLLALSSGVASAAVDTTPAECPVDGTGLRISILLSTNAILGHDRDLCPHAAGDDEIRSGVSACTRCGFAGTPKEFQQPLDPQVRAKVKKGLEPAGTPWESYANRARILEWREAPAQMVGESWLRAAWSLRLEERPVGPPLSGAIQEAVKALPKEAAGDDAILGTARALDAAIAAGTAKNPAASSYASGSFWRARGELAEADARYDKALSAAKGTPLEKAIADAVARDRASMDLERTYLDKALSYFRAGLAAGERVPRAQRALLAFLAAECARRTGVRDEAHRLYRMAEALDDGLQPQMKPLVEQGLADTRPAAGKAGGKSPE